jgi:hypothetical protein
MIVGAAGDTGGAGGLACLAPASTRGVLAGVATGGAIGA